VKALSIAMMSLGLIGFACAIASAAIVHSAWTVFFWVAGLIAVGFAWTPEPPLRLSVACYLRQNWRSLLIVAFASLLLNTFNSAQYPYNIHGDEGELRDLALSTDYAKRLFLPSSWWGIPTFSLLCLRVGLLFESGLVGIRLSAALWGLATNLAFFLVLRLRFQEESCLLSTLIYMTTPCVLHSYRIGADFVPPAFLTLIFVWCCLAFLRRDSVYLALLIGVCLGLSFNFYLSARMIPVVWLVVASLSLVFLPARRTLLWHWTVSGVMMVLTAGPLLVHYVKVPADAFPRREYLNDFITWWQDGILTVAFQVARQCVRLIGAAFLLPDTAPGAFFFYCSGFLWPVLSWCFIGSLILLIIKPRFSPAWFVLMAAVCGLVSLSGYGAVIHYHRLYPALVLMGVLSIDFVDLVLRSERRAGYALSFLAIIANLCFYTIKDGPNEENMGSSVSRHARVLAAELAVRPAAVHMFNLPGLDLRHGAFRLLAPDLRGKDYDYYYSGDIPSLFTKSEEHIVILEENFQERIDDLVVSLSKHFDVRLRPIYDFGQGRVDFFIIRLSPH